MAVKLRVPVSSFDKEGIWGREGVCGGRVSGVWEMGC